MAVRVILFDLFGTVVHFRRPDPGSRGAGAVLPWLQECAREEVPEIPFARLVGALGRVSEAIVQSRPPEYREVPSPERFRRALLELGVDERRSATAGKRLSGVHMSYLASLTVLPNGHEELLRSLARQYRLGMVSNFDHGATARRILDDHGIGDVFETILVSEEFGRRKPNPAIFHAALTDLAVRPGEAVFVGDSLLDDVEGGQRAGLPVVWLNTAGSEVPSAGPVPDHVIVSLTDLPSVVGAV